MDSRAWSVRQVLNHLVMPLPGSTGALLVQVVRARGPRLGALCVS